MKKPPTCWTEKVALTFFIGTVVTVLILTAISLMMRYL